RRSRPLSARSPRRALRQGLSRGRGSPARAKERGVGARSGNRRLASLGGDARGAGPEERHDRAVRQDRLDRRDDRRLLSEFREKSRAGRLRRDFQEESAYIRRPGMESPLAARTKDSRARLDRDQQRTED